MPTEADAVVVDGDERVGSVDLTDADEESFVLEPFGSSGSFRIVMLSKPE